MSVRLHFVAFVSVLCGSPAWAVDAPCLMEPHLTAKLATPVSGLLESVSVTRGDLVQAGAVLARLESRVEATNVSLARVRANNDANVRSRRARADFLTRKRDRIERLQSGNVASPASLDEADAEARVAQAELQEAALNYAMNGIELERALALLEQRTIRSPVSGVVTERVLSPGEFVHDQAHVLTVAQLDPLNIEAYLPQALLRDMVPGMTLYLRPEAPVGGRYAAVVATVDRVLDSRSGTFGVRLLLPNSGLALPAGIRCVLELPG